MLNRRNSRENTGGVPVRSNSKTSSSRPSSRPNSGSSAQQQQQQQPLSSQSDSQSVTSQQSRIQHSNLENSTDVSVKTNLNEESKTEDDYEDYQPIVFPQQPVVVLPECYPVFAQKRLNLKSTQKFEKSDAEHRKILAIKYSNNDEQVALSIQSGEIQIFDRTKQQVTQELRDTQIASPCTSLKWVPPQNALNTNNLLLAAYSNGTTLVWHCSSRKFLHRYEESDNPLNCLDVNKSGTKFATAGQDEEVRIYDLGKKSAPIVLEPFANVAPKHSNRIYCLKYNPEDENQLYSSGWDQLVIFWDTRHSHSSGFIFGPKIYGEAIDVRGNLLLTGSWREERQLQLWDLRKTQKPYANIEWKNYDAGQKPTSFVYCCQFQKNNGETIIAGTSGSNQIRVYDAKSKVFPIVDLYRENITSSVYSMDFANKTSEVFLGTANGDLLNFEVK